MFLSSLCRTLAAQQLAWHKKEGQFQWVNMAPGAGGQRLEMEEVGERIVQWLQNGTPLPPGWDGTPLRTLVCIHVHTLCYMNTAKKVD